MRRLILTALALLPVAALAQGPAPVTLTPEEYNNVISDLARRDPVMALLIQKQNQAQQAAAAKAHEAAPATPEAPK